MARSHAVVVEDLNPQRLREKLKSKDPEKAYLFNTWPVAKILRRVRAVAERAESCWWSRRTTPARSASGA